MTRRLSQDEKTLWDSVTNSVRPLDRSRIPDPIAPAAFVPPAKLAAALVPERNEASPVLDLHGKTLSDAHRAAMNHITDVSLEGTYRHVVIITGLSGQIYEEFTRWLEKHRDVRKVEPLRGGGAWKIWLRKKGTSTQTR